MAASPGSVPGFSAQHWAAGEGLPQNSVTSITQDKRGFLWMTTFAGVLRFDGRSFEVFDLTRGLRSPRAVAITAGPDNHLWIGLQDRGLQRMSTAGRPAPYGAPRDDGDVTHVAWSARMLWIVAESNLLVKTSTTWRTIARNVDRLAPDHTGGAWFTSKETLIHATDKGTDKTFVLPAPAISIGSDPSGTPWVVTTIGLCKLIRGKVVRVLDVTSDETSPGTGPIFTRGGALWMSVGQRLLMYADAAELSRQADGDQRPRPTIDVVRPGHIRTLFEDRERNVWIGTIGNGLWRLAPAPFEVIQSKQGDQSSVGGVVATRDGIAYGNFCDGVTRRTKDGAEHALEVGGCVAALHYDDADDTLWVSTPDRLERHRGDNVDRIAAPEGAHGLSPFLRDRRGRLWVGSRRGGVFRVDNDRLVAMPAGIVGPVSALAEDAAGRIWVGEQSRIVILDGEDQQILDHDDGIPRGQIRVIEFLENRTYIGSYGGGLSLLAPDLPRGFVRFDGSNGLDDNFLSAIFLDDSRFVWLSGNAGLARIPIDDFDAVAKGQQNRLRARVIQSGEPEGGIKPSLLFDGRFLWLPAVHGLVKVDVRAVVSNDAVPLAVIEHASVDHQNVAAAGFTIIPPGRGELRVRFRASMLRAPNLTSFEYRLDGLDGPEWRRVNDQNDVVIDGLVPGRYAFAVRAINEEDVVGPASVASFVLEPRLIQTTWFRTSAALVLLLLLFVAHRWRTGTIKRRNSALIREVDGRRRAQAALRDREMHYRRVFEASVNGFFIVSNDRTILDVNPAACEMFGYAAETLIGEDLDTIVGGPKAGDHPALQSCRHHDGSTFEARVREASYNVDDGDRTLVIVVDLSPLIEAQEKERLLRDQLLHSQRVEAMGRLAGGIAHDVNNMLTAVQNYAELALEELEDPVALRDDLLEIVAGVQRTAKVTKQLLAFGQRETADATAVDLVDLVRSIRPMLSRLSRDDINIVFESGEAVGPVRADPTHLEQIVVNLVINATHAMPAGGRITIRVEDVEVETAAIDYPQLGVDAPHVRLRVIDEGIGMTAETKARIFEPFFSTKETAESSGLGLSVVHGIVTQAGGHIVVESVVGAGTQFDLLFPRSTSAAAPLDVRATTTRTAAVAGARLLYCDDDDAARTATARILRRAGYDVVVARTPSDAMSQAEKMSEAITLLVTDVVMPEMDGRRLFNVLREKHDALSVLYVSGYAANVLDNLTPSESFLPKPYSPDTLLGRIHELLGDR